MWLRHPAIKAAKPHYHKTNSAFIQLTFLDPKKEEA
jgi:hypothetical protein